MKRSHIFEAEDGMTFATAAERRQHEEVQSLLVVLSDLSQPQVASGIRRIDVPLANAFERAGNIIAAKRRESGELKRAKKASGIEGVAKALAKVAK